MISFYILPSQEEDDGHAYMQSTSRTIFSLTMSGKQVKGYDVAVISEMIACDSSAETRLTNFRHPGRIVPFLREVKVSFQSVTADAERLCCSDWTFKFISSQ